MRFFKNKEERKFEASWARRNQPEVCKPFLTALNVSSRKFQDLIFVVDTTELRTKLLDMQFAKLDSIPGAPTDPIYPTCYGDVWYNIEFNIVLCLVPESTWKPIAVAICVTENTIDRYDRGQLRDIFNSALHCLAVITAGYTS